jgi:hypothetical protein
MTHQRSLNSYIDSQEKLDELKVALNRALNTWDTGPTWLFKLVDDIDAGKVRFGPAMKVGVVNPTVFVYRDFNNVELTPMIEQMKMARLSIDTTLKLIEREKYSGN